MIIELLMWFIYVKYFIRYLLIYLFTAKEHGYLALADEYPQIIEITEENKGEPLSYEEYIREIKIANELTLNELIVDVYNNKNLSDDERFELDCYMDLLHR